MKPFNEALEAIRDRTALPTSLGYKQLEALPEAIRKRALVLARVTTAEIIQTIDEDLNRIVAGVSSGAGDYADPATARANWKKLLDRLEYKPEAGREGTISDLRTDGRLNLIIDTETKRARGYGQWVQQNDPDAILVYPALEFIRIEPRNEPRDNWPDRWRAAGGEFYDGRMIAKVSSPVWVALSRFGDPHPPFDFNSGMGVRRIIRTEAERLGVIQKGERVPPQEVGIFEDKVPGKGIHPEYLKILTETGLKVDEEGMLTVDRKPEA